MTPERRQEIEGATKDAPVRLTDAEEVELRTEHRARFQRNVGAGRYILHLKPHTPAAQMMLLRNKGCSAPAIGFILGVSADKVRSTLRRVYV